MLAVLRHHTPDCPKISAAIQTSRLCRTRRCQRQRRFSGVPPGTYYLMISTRYNNQPYVWSQPVTLHPGANTLKLDLTNATLIK